MIPFSLLLNDRIVGEALNDMVNTGHQKKSNVSIQTPFWTSAMSIKLDFLLSRILWSPLASFSPEDFLLLFDYYLDTNGNLVTFKVKDISSSWTLRLVLCHGTILQGGCIKSKIWADQSWLGRNLIVNIRKITF